MVLIKKYSVVANLTTAENKFDKKHGDNETTILSASAKWSESEGSLSWYIFVI